MSTEVKPSLTGDTSSSGGDNIVNTWLDNFPNGYWADAEDRGYVWIISNVSYYSTDKGYEYKVHFDSPVSNFVINFPFVVKTSDAVVNSVVIDNTGYNTRSYENYGTSFIISGSYFSFKAGTRFKLSDQALPIVSIYYRSVVFYNSNNVSVILQSNRNVNPIFNNSNTIYAFLHDRDLFPSFYNNNIMKVFFPTILTNIRFSNVNTGSVKASATRNINPSLNNRNTVFIWLYGLYTSAEFYSKQVMNVINLDGHYLFPNFLTSQREDTNLRVWRLVNASYTSSNTLTVSLIKQKFIAPVFVNKNAVSCTYTRAHITQSMFINSQNMFILGIANCYSTDWTRFGGVWIGCQTWTT